MQRKLQNAYVTSLFENANNDNARQKLYSIQFMTVFYSRHLFYTYLRGEDRNDKEYNKPFHYRNYNVIAPFFIRECRNDM